MGRFYLQKNKTRLCCSYTCGASLVLGHDQALETMDGLIAHEVRFLLAPLVKYGYDLKQT